MALKKSKFCTISFVLLLLNINNALGQQKFLFDSLFTKTFNFNLDVVDNSLLKQSKKPIIVVSNINCSGCVKYFCSMQKDYTFLFILFSKSLLEIERLKSFYNLKSKDIYFTTCNYISDANQKICVNPTPCCIINKNNEQYIFNNVELSAFTNDYALTKKELKSKFGTLVK